MASIIPRTLRSRPVIVSATILGAVGLAYYTSSPRLQLDSAYNAPTKTLSFPSTMLFSKQLTVTSVEQVNHDTRRVTFALPGGKKEVAGVESGGKV